MKLGDQVFYVKKTVKWSWNDYKTVTYTTCYGTLVSVHDGQALVRSYDIFSKETVVEWDGLFASREAADKWLTDKLDNAGLWEKIAS